MQCLFFIWRPGHHRSSEELQGLGKGVMGDSKFKNSNVHGSHSNKRNKKTLIFHPKRVYVDLIPLRWGQLP